jgi:hypothetical protein
MSKKFTVWFAVFGNAGTYAATAVSSSPKRAYEQARSKAWDAFEQSRSTNWADEWVRIKDGMGRVKYDGFSRYY